MPPSYENSFGLKDNPFGPTKLLPGIAKNVMMMLVTKPLRIAEEPRLLKLYSERAGPFATHVTSFRNLIAAEGYTDDPPAVGFNPLISFIRGPIGTGKTTLTNVMVYWLKKCKPDPNKDWIVFSTPFSPLDAFTKQREDILALETKIRQLPKESFCCVILDNLVDGADDEALDMHSRVQDHCTVFLFLVSSKPELRKKTWLGTLYPVHAFETEELKPDTAIEFVKHRIDFYRVDPVPAFIANCNLFPFSEANIRAAIDAKSIGYNVNGGIITLRQFGQALQTILVEIWQGLDSAFSIATVQNACQNHEIDVVETYQAIMNKKMVA